ncbi:hypothetical protein QYF36_026686 [Acer negundo]|nr:hypothetical protein QYF36_026686 [Acer negundo]
MTRAGVFFPGWQYRPEGVVMNEIRFNRGRSAWSTRGQPPLSPSAQKKTPPEPYLTLRRHLPLSRTDSLASNRRDETKGSMYPKPALDFKMGRIFT